MYSNQHTLERKTTKYDHRLCALYDYEDFGSIKNINQKSYTDTVASEVTG